LHRGHLLFRRAARRGRAGAFEDRACAGRHGLGREPRRLASLHRAGVRKETVALSALARGPIISELLPLSDGTLVLAEAVPSAAYRCDIAARVCTSITAKVAASVGPTAHALMIAADEQRRRFYISDNRESPAAPARFRWQGARHHGPEAPALSERARRGEIRAARRRSTPLTGASSASRSSAMLSGRTCGR